MLPRGVDEYLERRDAARQAPAPGPARPGPGPGPAAPADSGRPRPSAADARAAQKELQRIERQLDRIGEKESRLHDEIARHATEFEKVAELDAQLRALAAERDELESRWLELAEDA
jgi:ATP-binding cassette subfamily F protein uup